MRRTSFAVVALSLVLAPGCSDELARQSEVDGLRLLAMAAEPPEAPPGAAVRVRALWSDLPGPDAPAFRWSSCPAPTDGSVDRCAGPEITLPSTATPEETTLQTPAATGTELVRLTICRGLFDADGGCTGENVLGAKRVVVSDSDAPNENPAIDALLLGDEPAGSSAIRPETETVVAVEASAGSAEPLDDGTNEELFVSWFATAGSFEDERSFGPEAERFETHWTAPSEPTAVTLWAVLRDRRGGVGWAMASVEVE